MSTDERALFAELVDSCDPRHFIKSDLPLLISFIQATLLVRRLAAKLNNSEAIADWERGVRVMAMLATRLRLAPQARLSTKAIGRYSGRQDYDRKPPWEDKE
jgi:hypothetical protein